jgi:hypothetical protein
MSDSMFCGAVRSIGWGWLSRVMGCEEQKPKKAMCEGGYMISNFSSQQQERSQEAGNPGKVVVFTQDYYEEEGYRFVEVDENVSPEKEQKIRLAINPQIISNISFISPLGDAYEADACESEAAEEYLTFMLPVTFTGDPTASVQAEYTAVGREEIVSNASYQLLIEYVDGSSCGYSISASDPCVVDIQMLAEDAIWQLAEDYYSSCFYQQIPSRQKRARQAAASINSKRSDFELRHCLDKDWAREKVFEEMFWQVDNGNRHATRQQVEQTRRYYLNLR